MRIAISAAVAAPERTGHRHHEVLGDDGRHGRRSESRQVERFPATRRIGGPVRGAVALSPCHTGWQTDRGLARSECPLPVEMSTPGDGFFDLTFDGVTTI